MEPGGIATKKCTKCGGTKSVGQFAANRHGADGRASQCKQCVNRRRSRAAKPRPAAAVKDHVRRGDIEAVREAVTDPKAARKLLGAAALHGRDEVFDYLLGLAGDGDLNGALVATVAVKATIPVTEANVRLAQALLKRGANPDARGGWNHDTALVWAATGGYTELVDVLLEAGATVDLYAAAALGRVEVVRAHLDDHRAAVESEDVNGMTALHQCARSGLATAAVSETAELLLDRGADPNRRDAKAAVRPFSFGYTAMEWAAERATLEFITLLLNRGAEVDPGGVSSQASLRGALGNSPEVVDLLINSGLDIDGADPGDGSTVLHGAANFPHPEKVEMLLTRGAAVDVRTHDGRTPLHRAAERNRSARVATMLVDAGATVNARDASAITPLGYALERGKEKVAQYLRGVGGVV